MSNVWGQEVTKPTEQGKKPTPGANDTRQIHTPVIIHDGKPMRTVIDGSPVPVQTNRPNPPVNPNPQ